MCIYICIYICICICIHMNIYMHTNIYLHLYIYIRMTVHIRTHVCMYVWVCVCVCVCVCLCLCACACVCVGVYTQIHVHICICLHMYICIHMYTYIRVKYIYTHIQNFTCTYIHICTYYQHKCAHTWREKVSWQQNGDELLFARESWGVRLGSWALVSSLSLSLSPCLSLARARRGPASELLLCLSLSPALPPFQRVENIQMKMVLLLIECKNLVCQLVSFYHIRVPTIGAWWRLT